MMTMRAARLQATQMFEIVETAIPQPEADQVLIRVEACGVCTSDSYFWNGLEKEYPYPEGSPGHEVYGVVQTVGSGVNALEPDMRVTSITYPGRGYAEYAVASAAYTSIVPASMNDEVVLGEPLACAVNAAHRSTVRVGDSVLLLGVGYMGALALQLLRVSGAAPLIAADVRDSSRRLASELGADMVLDPSSDSFQEEVRELTDGNGVDIVVEATGVQAAIDAATEAVRIRGTIVIYGYHVGGRRSIDLQRWNWKGLDIVNAHERVAAVRARGMQHGLRLLQFGAISNDLITHEFRIDDINDAFRMLREKPEGYVKAIIRP